LKPSPETPNVEETLPFEEAFARVEALEAERRDLLDFLEKNPLPAPTKKPDTSKKGPKLTKKERRLAQDVRAAERKLARLEARHAPTPLDPLRRRVFRITAIVGGCMLLLGVAAHEIGHEQATGTAVIFGFVGTWLLVFGLARLR
jgi:hypothetical protein